ncbi:hypothetical protein Cgig2_025930 [Carnegiea gigantea]|uniref:AB hydrolase-1 domain-containing protein n=1 Tax=Carnegiea gigantea TaxID=171969 RepID=A0A9Q1Q9C4_9CARY|nr:hypothetical protein Cgig2_025930 [Carnegiea gigantea]
MSRCFSFASMRDRCLESTFNKSGLRLMTTTLGDDTVMQCWMPKLREDSKPNLALIHGFGANAMWQWADIVTRMTRHLNVYVPYLVFFGESYTTRPERSDGFQAQCLMRLMEAHSVTSRLSVAGLSYGGFVAYSMAAQFPAVVDRVVIGSAAVCMEERDIVEGRFNVPSLDVAADILLPQTPEKLKELMNMTLIKPPKFLPNCFLYDFIQAMCTEYREERKELILAIPKDRKITEIPKIPQPTLIIWGDKDKVFPLEFAHRLKSHLGDNAQLVVIKNAGHAFNVEKPREFYRYLKAFLVDSRPSPTTCSANENGK